MPLLKGMTLEEYLRRGKPFPLPQVVRVGREVARGLQAAHERGLIHRDIKPANLWLDAGARGRVKILDFGLARPLQGDTHLTASGTIVGTPTYMAPEQMAGKPEARSDLYSLGVVLYRVLAGRLPFDRPDVLAQLLAVATEPPPPLRQLAPHVPAPLAELVMRLLEKKPEGRPASARELSEALKGVERELAGNPDKPAAAPAEALEVVEAEPLEAVELVEGRRPERPPAPARKVRHAPRRSPARADRPLWPYLLGGGVVVALVVVALGVLLGRLGPAAGVPPQAPEGAAEANPARPVQDFVPLFNGKDLTGWKVFPGGTGGWRVEGGAIVGSGPKSHLFSERADYRNFHIKVEAMINRAGNSCLGFRSWFAPGPPPGYEAQINATHAGPLKTGSLFPKDPDMRLKGLEVLTAPHGPDEWFTLEVICTGPAIRILVNGKKTVEWTDPRARHKQGHFFLEQNGPSSVVRFRKIEVRELAVGPFFPPED
jgi:hypothetical protein